MVKSKDEVELTYYNDDEDDMLVSRKRELDRKSEESINLERTLSQFVDIILQNQKIVENVVKANESLREDISVMVGKMDRLFDKFDEFVTIVKEAAKEDEGEEVAKEVVKTSVEPLLDKFEEFNKNMQESNQMLLDVLMSIEKKIKRLGTSNSSSGDLKERMMQLLANKESTGSVNPITPSTNSTNLSTQTPITKPNNINNI